MTWFRLSVLALLAGAVVGPAAACDCPCPCDGVGVIRPTTDPVAPDGTTRAEIDIPVSRHIRNTGGSDGAGLCVFTSGQLAADWQHVRELDGWRKWMERRPGGGWPEKVDDCLTKFCKEKGVAVPPYVQHTGGDVKFLELAIATGRMPSVTYAGRDDFYNSRIAHMVNLAHLDKESAAIIDNNRPGKWVWMSRSEFLDRWRDMQGGWAYVFLAPPPPPHPTKPRWAAVAANLSSRLTAVAGDVVDGSCFGVDEEKLRAGTRWILNGVEVNRAAALRAFGEEDLVDDSDRYHLTAVGDETFLSAARVSFAKLTSADRQRFHFHGYTPDRWEVKAFDLTPGVTVRKPAVDRYGADAGKTEKAEGLLDLVDAIFRPKPPAPPTPPAPPAPAPGPNVPPTPVTPEPDLTVPGWVTLLSGAVLALLARFLTPKGYTIAVVIVNFIVDRMRATPAPATPSDRPILDAAIELMKQLARKKFPWLSTEAAVMRFAAELAQTDAAEQEAKAAAK